MSFLYSSIWKSGRKGLERDLKNCSWSTKHRNSNSLEEKVFGLEWETKGPWHMAAVVGRKNNYFLVHPLPQLVIWLMILGAFMMGISWSKQRQRLLGLLKPRNSLIPRWLSRQHHHKGSSMKMALKAINFQGQAWNNCGKENRGEDRAKSVHWKWKGKK